MTIKRYHVNEKGVPGRCLAQYRCRFGGEGAHYPSEQDARWGYERKMVRLSSENNQLPKGTIERLPEGIVSGNSFTIPAGRYFVGDPYLTIALKDQAGWNEIVESIDQQFGWENDLDDPAQEKAPAIGALYNGEPMLAVKGWHGEGLYWSIGPTHRIPSETGLVGVVPHAMLEKMGFDLKLCQQKRLGADIEVSEETTVWRDEQGVIVVGGKLVICHNDLVQSEWFNSLDAADGKNPSAATAETYSHVLKKAQMWAKNPALLKA